MPNQVTIMLVDDDMEDRMIFTDSIRENYPADQVLWAEGGQEMLSSLGTLYTQQALPALIVLDLNMPRLNGVETLRKLKEEKHYAHIPVIILSTSVNETQKTECIALGAVHYLIKASTYRQSLDVSRFIHNFALQSTEE